MILEPSVTLHPQSVPTDVWQDKAVRVLRDSINLHLVVKVRCSSGPSASDLSDNLPSRYGLTGLNDQLRSMAVERCVPETVVDFYGESVSYDPT